MFAATLQAGRQPQNIVRREAIGGFDRGESRLALGERAGLVHHQRIGPLQNFEGLGVLEKHAVLGARGRCRP